MNVRHRKSKYRRGHRGDKLKERRSIERGKELVNQERGDRRVNVGYLLGSSFLNRCVFWVRERIDRDVIYKRVFALKLYR